MSVKELIIYGVLLGWTFGVPVLTYLWGYWKGRAVECNEWATAPALQSDPEDRGDEDRDREEFGVPRSRVAEMLGGANEMLETPIHWRKLTPATRTPNNVSE